MFIIIPIAGKKQNIWTKSMYFIEGPDQLEYYLRKEKRLSMSPERRLICQNAFWDIFHFNNNMQVNLFEGLNLFATIHSIEFLDYNKINGILSKNDKLIKDIFGIKITSNYEIVDV